MFLSALLSQFRENRRLDPDCKTLLAMHAGWSGSQRLVSIVHLHTQKNPSGKCIYHAEYGIVIQHKDAAKPLFQNLNTLLFKASDNSGATYWGVEHL